MGDTSLLVTVPLFLSVLGAVTSIPWAVYKKRKKLPLKYPLIGCAASLTLLLCAMYFAFDSGVNGERMLPDSAGVSDSEGNSDARVEQDFDTIAEIAPEEVTPEKGNVSQSDTSIDDFPFVTFDEIASGNYKNKIVCVEAIVDNVEHTFYRDVYGGSSFDLWYQSEGAYICSKLHHIFDSNITAYPGNEDFKNIANGDVIRYVTLINRDNSFGTAQSRAVKIVGHIDIQAFRENLETSERATQPIESVPLPPTPELFEVKLTADVDVNDGYPTFTVYTNLPDQTKLGLTLRDGYGYTGQASVEVKNGVATSSEFSNRGEALSGKHTLSVSMSLARLQPKAVQAVIGKHGEYITGSYVQADDITGDNWIAAEFEFNLTK